MFVLSIQCNMCNDSNGNKILIRMNVKTLKKFIFTDCLLIPRRDASKMIVYKTGQKMRRNFHSNFLEIKLSKLKVFDNSLRLLRFQFLVIYFSNIIVMNFISRQIMATPHFFQSLIIFITRIGISISSSNNDDEQEVQT